MITDLPCKGMLLMPSVSMDVKKILSTEWKKTFTKKYTKSFAFAYITQRKLTAAPHATHS